MGKGKKRDKNKKEISVSPTGAPAEVSQNPNVAAIEAPSTSSVTEVASSRDVSSTIEQENISASPDSGGLGIPSRIRKKKQKSSIQRDTPEPMSLCASPAHVPALLTEVAASSTDVAASSTGVAIPPAEVAIHPTEVPPQSAQDNVESDVGLGLSKSKSKSRPRKKKHTETAQAIASAKVIPTEAPSGSVSPTPESVPGGARKKEPKVSNRQRDHGPKKSELCPMVSKDPKPGMVSAWKGVKFGDGPSTRSVTHDQKPSTSKAAKGDDSQTTSESFAKLKIKQEEKYKPTLHHIPPRYRSPPSFDASMSRALKILVNYLPLKFLPLKIYRYDVSFHPDKPRQKLTVAYQLAKERLFPNEILAFDQVKNCFSLNSLMKDGDETLVTVVEIHEENDKTLRFEIQFKFTGIVDLNILNKYMQSGTSLSPPTEAIQCIDVILKQGTLEKYVRAGRQYFMRPYRPHDLGDGLEMWTGLFQSAIFTSSPYLNIDVAHKGFPRHQSMIDAMHQDFRIDLKRPVTQQRGRGVECFLEFIKALRVTAKLLGPNTPRSRDFICNGIADPPFEQTFNYTDHESNQQVKMTVGEYFRRIKGYNIRYPNMNCLWVGPRDRGIFFPMELLDVSYGQVRNRQLNEKQLSKMVREAATPPDHRKKKIEEVIQDMKYSTNPYFRHFGLQISEQFIQIEAKVLDAPSLAVGPRQTIKPKNGAWNTNSLFQAEALKFWGVMSIDLKLSECNGDTLVHMVMDVGRQMGMQVTDPMFQKYNVRVEELHQVLSNAVDRGCKLLFIIISRTGRDVYAKVKQMAECRVGILTQCIKEVTVTTRLNTQTTRNILLKVNSKLMGINQVLDAKSTPPCLKGGDVMVIGADVTHPSPEQKTVPSIAAVTASMDLRCSHYNIALSVQSPKQEMIVQFEDMMLEHLRCFKQLRGNLPRKFYIFRDGVSEGQFSHVMAVELKALHLAYEKLEGTNGPKPEVLFMLVQKRHHTRFFLPTGQTQYNVSPGTVVDTHIVHPHELDFYLVSHSAIKGTARPTRYHAVCNDGKIKDSEVEQLAYYLCHLYARCMRAVSYPTPTYYAHLACLRARALTHGQCFFNSELEQNPKRLRVLDKMLQYSRMFFV